MNLQAVSAQPSKLTARPIPVVNADTWGDVAEQARSTLLPLVIGNWAKSRAIEIDDELFGIGLRRSTGIERRLIPVAEARTAENQRFTVCRPGAVRIVAGRSRNAALI